MELSLIYSGPESGPEEREGDPEADPEKVGEQSSALRYLIADEVKIIEPQAA